MKTPILRLALALAIAAPFTGCGNPAVDDAIAALGPEDSEVPPGEFHRPGQPCVDCHSELGGASPRLAVGGTVFASRFQAVPVDGAIVSVTDSAGETRQARTNCVGNFFVEEEDWAPQFPLLAEVEFTDPTTNEVRVTTMGTRIGRDGSCASCHKLEYESQSSPGFIYCLAAGGDFPAFDLSCPGKLPVVPNE